MTFRIRYFIFFATFLFGGTVSNFAQSVKTSGLLDIVFIGNSITYGAQLADPAADAPPVHVSQFLRETSGFDVRYNNQGRSGATTVDYLPSGQKYLDQVIAATHAFHLNSDRALIFSICLGTNDSAEEGPNGAPVDPKDFGKNLTQIIDKLFSEFPSARVILQQPIWYSENTYNSSRYMAEGLSRLRSYFPVLKSVVKRYAMRSPDKVFMGDVKSYEYFKKNYLTDHVPESGQAGTFYLHPNEKGAQVLATYWAKSIAKRFK